VNHGDRYRPGTFPEDVLSMVVEQDLTIYRGSAAVLNFAASPVENISGWTIHFAVARANGSATKAIGPITAAVVDGPTGTYRVSLTAALTNIRPADYQYDVWRVDAGQETLLRRGSFTLLDSVRLP